MRVFSLILLCLFLYSCGDRENGRRVRQATGQVMARSASSSRPLWDSTNKLKAEVQTLRLEYIVFGCWCAPWRILADSTVTDTASLKGTIWLEPATVGLYEPEMDTMFVETSGTVLVKGQFYEREDFPRGTYEMEEKADKARVFRYTWIKAVKRKRS